MDPKLTFLGRMAQKCAPTGSSRWRVRVELPLGFRPVGLTVGLWGEDDKPLGPAVVAPAGVDGLWEAELAGPMALPPGTMVRCVADVDAPAPVVYWLAVDERVGLHAFLHADARLPVGSVAKGRAVEAKELTRLAGAFPWLQPARAPCAGSVADPDIPEELKDLLREEFGVDLDEEAL